ncbi:MAG: M20/M25/M40 family metallo-hydrolase [Promethearchaeota archaeon]|nr:MAG: M20/M25/M40 family metallo-hydrolase [Candidatus Lokiarchaeota archaeon]
MTEKNIEIKKITKTNTSFIKNELTPFLQISSESHNPDGISKTLEFIKSSLSPISENIIEFKGEFNPILLSYIEGNTESSLLIYMMYDTQPIKDNKSWISPPFKAKIRKLPFLPKLGDCIIARGAYNSKTPLIGFLNVIKILKSKHALPFSLYLLFDGEEEIGSPSLPYFIQKYEKILKECNGVYYPALKQNLEGKAVLKLGYKGIISLTIETSSENEEVHSSYSNVIPNPARDLIKVINLLYSNNQISIHSLSSDYQLNNEEDMLIENLKSSINIEKIAQKAGVNNFIFQDPRQFFLKYLFDPTFNISTLKSGYLNTGIKNSVPNSCSCNIDIRFAHDVPIENIFDEIQEKAKKLSSLINSNLNISKTIGYRSSRVSKDSKLVKSLIDSFKELNISTELWPISAAASPLNILQNNLETDYITGGLGVGGYAHTANEFVQLKSIENARIGYYLFLMNYQKYL